MNAQVNGCALKRSNIEPPEKMVRDNECSS